MKVETYIKPSGKEMTVNDSEETRHYAHINGWKRKPKQQIEVKRKTNKDQQLDKLL